MNQACDPFSTLFKDQIDQVAADDTAQFAEHVILWVSHPIALKGWKYQSMWLIMGMTWGDVKHKTGLPHAFENLR
jgi:hypothetical protein